MGHSIPSLSLDIHVHVHTTLSPTANLGDLFLEMDVNGLRGLGPNSDTALTFQYFSDPIAGSMVQRVFTRQYGTKIYRADGVDGPPEMERS